MQKIIIEPTKSAHVDAHLFTANVERLDVLLTIEGVRNKKSLFVFFRVEGVEKPWKSEGMEIRLGKRQTKHKIHVTPSEKFSAVGGIAPHLCVCFLDEEKRHLKSTVQWSLEAEF